MLAIAADLSTQPTNLKRLYTVTRRDGVVKRFTDHTESYTVSSETWLPMQGLVSFAVTKTADASVASGKIDVSLGSIISVADIRNGKYDGAVVRCDLFDPRVAGVKSWYYTREAGQIQLTNNSRASIALRGKTALAKRIATEKFGSICNTFLGSFRCKIPLVPEIGNELLIREIGRNEPWAVGEFGRIRIGSAGTPFDFQNVYFRVTTAGTTDSVDPGYDGTPGNSTVDGTATFIAVNAWARAARVASIVSSNSITLTASPDPRAVNDWFNLGLLIFRSGYSEGEKFKCADWIASSKTVKFFADVTHRFAVNDYLEICPGCNRILTDHCSLKFSNAVNNRAGAPYDLGRDSAGTVAQV